MLGTPPAVTSATSSALRESTIAYQQVQRPAPGPRAGCRRDIGGDYQFARRRRQACRRLRFRAAPDQKNAQYALLVHHGTKKATPSGRLQIMTLHPYAGITRQVHGVIGMSSGAADKFLLCRKGPTSQPGSPSSPCPVCSAGNSHYLPAELTVTFAFSRRKPSTTREQVSNCPCSNSNMIRSRCHSETPMPPSVAWASQNDRPYLELLRCRCRSALATPAPFGKL